MSVEETSTNQKAKARKFARALLVKNAVECTQYVAIGRVMNRQLAEQFGITEQEAGGILAVACVNLCDHIGSLTKE